MEELKNQFQKEVGESFKGIPINGLHKSYIEWLEARVKELEYDKEQLMELYNDAIKQLKTNF